MNKIFKVIYSKVRNCYVVTSEFAKANTKSSTGSTRGTMKKSLLSLAIASALFCGGLVNVGASVQSETILAGGTASNPVLTVDNTDDATQLNKVISAAKDDKLVTKDNISGQLTDYAKTSDVTNTLSDYAKTTDMNTALARKANADDVYSKTDADNKFADKTTTENALATKANQSDLEAATGRITTAEGEITALKTKTGKLSTDGKSLTDMDAVSGTTVSGDTVNAGSLTVTGSITDGVNTTTLSDIKNSMAQTETNKTDIATLKTTTGEQDAAINELKDKTTNISYDSGKQSTSINGIEIGSHQVDMGGKNLTDVGTINGIDLGKKEGGTYISQDGSIWGNMKKVDTQVKMNAENIETNKAAITTLDTKVGTVGTGDYLDPTKSVGDNLGLLDAGLKKEVGDRTAAVEAEKTAREAEDTNLSNRIGTVTEDGTYIKKSTTNNVSENLKVLDTQAKTNADAIAQETADRKAAIGELAVNGNYIEKDKSVSDNLVKLDNRAKANADEIVKTNERTGGIARNTEKTQTTIEGIVKVDNQGNVKDVKGLSAETINTTGDATIGGDLKVAGTITTDKMIFGDPATNNYTEIDKGKVVSKNLVVNGAGQTISSSSTFDVEKNEVGFTNTATGDHSYYKQTAKGINGYVTDKDGNKTYTKVTATENSFQVQDKDGKNKNHQVNTMGSSVTEITNGDGKTTKTEQTAENITNTAKDGTIKNDAKNIVNNASENITTTAKTMDTTVTGKATESYGELDTTVNGMEKHTVNGNQDIHVTGKQTNTVESGQENIISGGQINNITGDQTTTVTGDISNKAENITNEANTKLTDKVGDNTRVLDREGITDTVPGADGKGSTFKQRIDAIMGNVKTDAGESEVTQKGDEITSVVGKEEATNSRVTQKKDLLEAAVTDGTNYNISNDTANASAKVLTDGTKVNKLQDNLNSSVKTITNGTYTTSKVQTALDITNTASDGTIKNDAKNIVNNASENITNTAKTMNTTVTGKATESYGELETTVTGQATENYNGGLKTDITGEEIHTVTGNQTNKVTGKQTNTVEGGQENIISGGQINNITGDQTTIISGTQTTTATDINRNASSSMVDKVDNAYGTNTETKEAGKTTTDVSIKGTGEKGQYIRGANESRDYLTKGTLTNSETKTAGATSTEITDGNGKTSATIQDVTQISGSVTDGRNTSVQNQTASAIAAAVKDGAGNENASAATATTSANTIKSGSKANTVISTADGTSFINSGAAARVNGDGTYLNTTIKGNTITTGKVTMDYAEVMKDLGVHGNAKVDKNLEVTGTSTLTGDVTMENNATVKKNLTVEGTTTTKTLKVTENATVGGTLDVTKKATFRDDVDITKNLSVGGNATITGDVTANSYKVGDKTYISAAGINANDQKITNVADGSISEGSKDAVNGGQLFETNRRIDQFDSRINEVGANAAAMANLHPMEFDADSKLNVAVGVGNYRNKTATAMGLFYRPNEDVMFNVSSTIGSNDNMVGGGISFRLGSGGNKEKTKALAQAAEQNKQLKSQVDTLQAQMDALLSVINPNMSKDFPDVPNNHWAYEAVSRLAGNDIIQGYEDGKYHGERTMTRYEMAVIIYKALQKGAKAEAKLVEEFKPELKAIAAHEKA